MQTIIVIGLLVISAAYVAYLFLRRLGFWGGQPGCGCPGVRAFAGERLVYKRADGVGLSAACAEACHACGLSNACRQSVTSGGTELKEVERRG